MNIEEIHQLADIMSTYSLEVLELEDKNMKICLKKAGAGASAVPYCTSESAPTAQRTEPKQEVLEGKVVTAPIVGVFYSAPSPGEAAFVSVGSTVSTGDTLCIVEAMKMMNEITSEFDGKVSRILVEDGQMVEFGQPIMTLV